MDKQSTQSGHEAAVGVQRALRPGANDKIDKQ